MVTDSWESIKSRVARMLGRGDAKQIEAAQERLDLSRAALDGLAGTELGQARTEQEIVWRTKLADLLEAHPEAARRSPARVEDRRIVPGPIREHSGSVRRSGDDRNLPRLSGGH